MKCANETVTIELKNGAFMFCACILDFVVTACCLRKKLRGLVGRVLTLQVQHSRTQRLPNDTLIRDFLTIKYSV